MSRISLLKVALNKEDYKGQAEAILAKDKKFIKRSINEINSKIDEIEGNIEERLSTGEPIDKALVTSTYAELVKQRIEKELWEAFEAEYIDGKSED